MTQRLYHIVGGEELPQPISAEIDMLKQLPLADLEQYDKPSAQLSKQRAARLQELLHFCATGGLTQTGK